MPKTTLGDVLQHMRNVFEAERSRDLTDADLLQRFLAEREGAAFAVLVQRHRELIRTGNLWEDARRLVRLAFLGAGVAPGPDSPRVPPITVSGTWWQRQRRARRIR